MTLAGNWLASQFERRLVDRFLPVSNAIAVGSKLPAARRPTKSCPISSATTLLRFMAKPTTLEQLPKHPFILFVGDLRRFKGVHVLIEAYAGLIGAPPLVLIGRKCHDTPTHWPKNVHVFHDWPHAAVMHAWSRSMMGVLPSVGPEACGIVLLEAMASGKPMIASTAGGIPDIVDDNVNGLLVQPGDPRGLAQAIRALVADEPLRGRLAAGALRKAAAFKASNVVPRIEAVYRDVLDRKRPAAATVDRFASDSLPAVRIPLESETKFSRDWGQG